MIDPSDWNVSRETSAGEGEEHLTAFGVWLKRKLWGREEAICVLISISALVVAWVLSWPME